MRATPVPKSPLRSRARAACDGLPHAERETPPKEELPRKLKRHTVESLERTVMQKAGATKAIGETRMSFEDVPGEVIDELCTAKTNVHLKEFDRTESTISIRMPSSIHASASGMGAALVRRALARAGMGRAMMSWGRTTSPDVPWQTRAGKSADAAFQLKPQFRMGHNLRRWPQIVVETAASERSPEQLLADVSRWFKIAGKFLRVVMTISVKRRYVTLAIWKIGKRTGTFKHLGELVAHRVGARLEVSTTSAPIIVPFSVVFMREPHEGEKDLVFSPQDFMELKGDLEICINEREDEAKKPRLQHVSDEEVPGGMSEGEDEEGMINCEDIPQPKRRRRQA